MKRGVYEVDRSVSHVRYCFVMSDETLQKLSREATLQSVRERDYCRVRVDL